MLQSVSQTKAQQFPQISIAIPTIQINFYCSFSAILIQFPQFIWNGWNAQ